MEVQIKRLFDEARTPVYSSDGANCFDFFTPIDGSVGSYGSRVIDTGVAFDIPAGYCLLIFSRSGHGFKNDIRLSNCVGVIDSDFVGSVKVKIKNDSEALFQFNAGDRIAQGMLLETPRIFLKEVEELDKFTKRGENGLGSTGN